MGKLFTLFVISCFFVSCIIDIDEPLILIEINSYPAKVIKGKQCKLICDAYSPIEGEIYYKWSSQFGSFTNGNVMDTVFWLSPDSVGIYTINLEISDGKSTIKNSIDITVFQIEFDVFKDLRDGRSYPTAKYDNQEWMTLNLMYLPDINPSVEGSNDEPKYYVVSYEEGTDIEIAKTYVSYYELGVLYNYSAATEVCPNGWHLPSNEEWHILTDFIFNQYGAYDKLDYNHYEIGQHLKSDIGWGRFVEVDGDGIDDLGFSAHPAGSRTIQGTFESSWELGSWWSYDELDESNSFSWNLSCYNDQLDVNTDIKATGLSVRCVKD